MNYFAFEEIKEVLSLTHLYEVYINIWDFPE